MSDFNLVKSESKSDTPPAKAVMALETTRTIAASISGELAILEKRLEHVSLAKNVTEMSEKAPSVPTDPSSEFVSGIIDLNNSLRKILDRIGVTLQYLEI